MKLQVTNQRIVTLALILGGLLALAGLRLFHLQLIERSWLKAKAMRQATSRVDMPARRGSILDRNGVVLAESLVTESVFVNTRQAKDKPALARDLATHLGLSYPATLARLRQGRPFYAKRGAPLAQTTPLKACRQDALSFEAEYTRHYPQGRLASHVLGFEGADGHGLEGVEKQYDRTLSGAPGVMLAARDARGKALLSDNVVEREPRPGSDITLTIDSRLQHIAERELERSWQKFRARWGGIVVMDPATGEVLAMASMPDYDPNRPADYPLEARRNRVVADAFEPGSTFKLVTATLALEQGVMRPDTLVDCQHGHANFLGRVVRDHEDSLGVVPFSEAMAQSSNVGMVTAAMKVGATKMRDGASRFGFGERTGIDLPGETPGLLRPLKDWSGISLAAVAFGQELSCNLLHVACAYAPYANDGKRVRPRVFKDCTGGLLDESGPDRVMGTTVVGGRVKRQVIDMLKAVVDHGTGTQAAIPGYLVAGKTGTAEKYDAALRRYNYAKNMASFVGFVPADSPRLLIAVVFDEPKGITLGGWVSGPVFREAASAMLATLGVQPDPVLAQGGKGAQAAVPCVPGGKPKGKPKTGLAADKVEEITVPDLKGLDAAHAQKALKDAGLRGRPRGAGVVSSQLPAAGESVRTASTVTYLLKPAGSDGPKAAAKPAAPAKAEAKPAPDKAAKAKGKPKAKAKVKARQKPKAKPRAAKTPAAAPR